MNDARLCGAHQKSRALRYLREDSLGRWSCLPGYECKAAGVIGVGGVPGSDMRFQCAVHGKIRSFDCLQDNGLGQLVCLEERRCKGTDQVGALHVQALIPGMEGSLPFAGSAAPPIGIAFDAYGNPVLGVAVASPQFVDANGVAYDAQFPGASFGFPQGPFPGALHPMLGKGMGAVNDAEAKRKKRKAKRSRSPTRKRKKKKSKKKKKKSERKRRSAKKRTSESSSSSSVSKSKPKKRKRREQPPSKKKCSSSTPTPSSSASASSSS